MLAQSLPRLGDAVVAATLEEPVDGVPPALGDVPEQFVRQCPVGLREEQVANLADVIREPWPAASWRIVAQLDRLDESVLGERGEVLTGAGGSDVEVCGDVFDGGVADPPHGVEHRPAPHGDRRRDRHAGRRADGGWRGHHGQAYGRMRWLSPNSCHW